MSIFSGSLFLASAILLNSIESSSQVTLRDIFPESEGDIFPTLREFKYRQNQLLVNLRRIISGHIIEFESNSILVARGLIIIGWKQRDVIRPLSDLNGETNHVYGRKSEQFISLNPEDLWKLGVGRRISYIRTADEAALRISNQKFLSQAAHGANLQAINEANSAAIQRANLQVLSQAHYLANLQRIHDVNPAENVQMSPHENFRAIQQPNFLRFQQPHYRLMSSENDEAHFQGNFGTSQQMKHHVN